MKSMKKQMSAKVLMIVLAATMVLLILAGVGGFLFMISKLESFAEETNRLETEASAGDANLNVLQSLKATIESERELIDKTHQIVAESQSYQYQDDIIKDISAYANQSGLTVTGYIFSGGAAATTTAPSAPAIADPSTLTTGDLAGGVKSTSVDISLKTPAPYTNIMKFVQKIEQNVTKMQIANLALSRTEGSQVDLPSLQIQVYIR